MSTIEEWSKRLSRLTRERLVRECRAKVVLKDLKGAYRHIIRLLERTDDDESTLSKNVGLLARALSDLQHDRDSIQKIIKLLSHTEGRTAGAASSLVDQYNRLIRDPRAGRFEESNQVWMREITENSLILREYLPDGNATGEPDEADIHQFLTEINALFCASDLRRDKDTIIDVLMIILEYCPIDESQVKNLAGSEERIFIRLGPRARLTAVRAIRQLGESESLRKKIITLSDGVSEDGSGRLRLIAGIMGGLGHQDFHPVLCSLLKHNRSRTKEAFILDALGRSAHPQAGEQLVERIAGIIKKPGEKWFHERLEACLSALGRFARRRVLGLEQRRRLVGRMVQLGRSAKLHVSFLIAEKLFSNRPGELDASDVEWAAGTCVDAMWGRPFRDISLFRGQTNGWRQPMVDALLRLGVDSWQTIAASANNHKADYSGAMAALANVIEGIGDTSCVPLLDTMIRRALMHDDVADDQDPFREKVSDAGTGRVYELDRDDVIDTMLRALVKIGGDRGLECALDIADQMQAGRVKVPGRKTPSFLMDLKIKQGVASRVTRKAKVVEMDDKDFKFALGEARGGLMIRKNKQIAAIAVLGSTRRSDAIPVLLEALNEKDSMINAAAHNALTCFVDPLPDEKEFGCFLDAILEQQGSFKGRRLGNLLEFIRNEIPKNKPYDQIYARRLAANLKDGALCHQFVAAGQKSEPKVNQEFGEEVAGNREVLSLLDSMSEMDRKRMHMLARKEWIQGGKRGDPPEMPEEQYKLD